MEKTFTDQNFAKEVLEASQTKAILVDFWAPWCGPCQIMGPIIEELAKEVGDEFVIGKLNVDENPKKSEEYAIMSIPTLKIFKGGREVENMAGVQSKEALLKLLQKHK